MQTVTDNFTNTTNSNMRLISWACLMSFYRTYASGATFFTIGTSTIGGEDVIKGEGSVLQEWDKYNYDDYSYKIKSLEVTREQDDTLGGSYLSIADIVLDNTDDYFTPKSNSPIADYILPFRPVKLFAGFNGENIPLFVGLTDSMPKIDYNSKEASFHCIDFLSSLYDMTLDEVTIFEDYTVDEVIEELLVEAGLSTSQFILDASSVTIKYFYADKGETLGTVIRKLCQAEIGKIYMDENGMIRFINRQNWANNSATLWHFDDSNIIEKETPDESNIINLVKVKLGVREVQSLQKVYESIEAIEVEAGSTVEIWADLDDPTTVIDLPTYSATEISDSYYSTNQYADGSGSAYDAYISIDNYYLFSKSYKITFANSHPTDSVYITNLTLWGTPAKVINSSYVTAQNDDSIAKYDEQYQEIDNEYIQEEYTGQSLANLIVNDNSEYDSVREIIIKGVPQIQLGDIVNLSEKYGNNTYYIKKIVTKVNSNGITQTLTLVDKTIKKYFTIGISSIGGTDEIFF